MSSNSEGVCGSALSIALGFQEASIGNKILLTVVNTTGRRLQDMWMPITISGVLNESRYCYNPMYELWMRRWTNFHGTNLFNSENDWIEFTDLGSQIKAYCDRSRRWKTQTYRSFFLRCASRRSGENFLIMALRFFKLRLIKPDCLVHHFHRHGEAE